jgi:CheY-like chemotaxis protein
VSNALKFTSEGEVWVTVTSRRLETGAHELLFAVKDTGIGIPEDRLGRLFASFSQVETSTTRHYGGTGLGLAICKRLSEMMGGRIWVESRPGVGSTFFFTIRTEAAPITLRVFEHKSLPQLSGRHVLIVDDNATNRRIMTLQTQMWGMLPRAAASGEEALSWIRDDNPFEVVILDGLMPGMDGPALAQEIRKQKASRTVPLVMVTSLGRHSEFEGKARAEFSAFLTKPLKPSHLYDALIQIFSETSVPSRTNVPGTGISRRNNDQLPLRILLAEDNVVNQRVAILLLEKLGYHADLAGNGNEVMHALKRQPYDVVLMDVHMPELDGLEAARRIHREWPAGARPRIVALTASATEEDRQACLDAGMDDYIAKPVRLGNLQLALEKCVPLPAHSARPAKLQSRKQTGARNR